MGGWAHFPHMADIGVHGEGDSMEEAFEQAALALTAVVADPAAVRPEQSVDVACEAPDPELLLFDWLNAWIYEMATRRMLFSRFEAVIDPGRVRGRGWGEPVDRARHAPAVEPKGATHTALEVRQDPDGTWHARCVVDV